MSLAGIHGSTSLSAEQAGLSKGGCPIKVLGHDRQRQTVCKYYFETVNNIFIIPISMMNTYFKKYNSTVSYLYSLQKHGIKLGLANISELMGLLGNPHNSFYSVHVAGTNGKGSTSSAIASILMESGFKVGLFTSPHLVSFTERIRINNIQISKSDVIEIASKVHDAMAGRELTPTFFEFVTAMAFYYFAQNKVQWAVVETGMGGRLDATNVILPQASIITNVSLEHCEFLGSNISDIAFEKAGIIKPETPLITSSNIPEAVNMLKDIAFSRHSEIHIYDKEFKGTLLLMDDKYTTFNYEGKKDLKNLKVSLSGKYQLYNACTAIRTCEILREKGFPISDDSIRSGLMNVNIEGRLEWVSKSPPIIVDGAHNPDAAKALSDSVKTLFPDKKIILIAGIMDDKDIKGILDPLVHISGYIILTRPKYERSALPEKLYSHLMDFKDITAPVMIAPSVYEALELAKKLYRKDNIILATGSFYTAGEVKEIFGCSGAFPDLRERFRVGS
jgi:dihydrofolate synthase/folylpolyglutamate synthase